MFFVQMEAGLMKKVRPIYRSWTPDSYFSLRKPIHRGEVRGKMSRGNVRIPQQQGADFLFCPRAQNTPATCTPLLLVVLIFYQTVFRFFRRSSQCLFIPMGVDSAPKRLIPLDVLHKCSHAIKYNTIQCNTMQYNSIQYNIIQCNTIQYNLDTKI